MNVKSTFVKKVNSVWKELLILQEVWPVEYPTRTQEKSDTLLPLRLDRLEMCSDLVKGGLRGTVELGLTSMYHPVSWVPGKTFRRELSWSENFRRNFWVLEPRRLGFVSRSPTAVWHWGRDYQGPNSWGTRSVVELWERDAFSNSWIECP